MDVNYNDGKPSPEELRDHFCYEPETGLMFSRTNRRNCKPGDVVGTRDRQGYIVTSLYKRMMRIHRMAWAMTYGRWPVALIDHINGNKSDNRISNLRESTNSENKQNIGKSAANRSGFLGVSFHKKTGKWAANIKLGGQSKYLGVFQSPADASAAYQAAKSEMHPFGAGEKHDRV